MFFELLKTVFKEWNKIEPNCLLFVLSQFLNMEAALISFPKFDKFQLREQDFVFGVFPFYLFFFWSILVSLSDSRMD